MRSRCLEYIRVGEVNVWVSVALALWMLGPAVAEIPTPNVENLVKETTLITILALSNAPCIDIFHKITGKLPKDVFSDKVMKLFWVPTAHWAGPTTLASTVTGRAVGMPRVLMYGDRLMYLGPIIAARTLIHELVHVAMYKNLNEPKKEAKREEQANLVARTCIGLQ